MYLPVMNQLLRKITNIQLSTSIIRHWSMVISVIYRYSSQKSTSKLLKFELHQAFHKLSTRIQNRHTFTLLYIQYEIKVVKDISVITVGCYIDNWRNVLICTLRQPYFYIELSFSVYSKNTFFFKAYYSLQFQVDN